MQFLSIKLCKYKRLSLNHIDYIEITPKNKIQLLLGTNGSGKAQPLNSHIKVPNGWDIIGNMKIGTEVIARDGTTTTVTGIFPQGVRNIFSITFADGRKVQATEDHLWSVYVGGKQYPIKPSLLTTRQILTLLSSKTYHHLLWIDLPDSEKNTDIYLPVDAYALGVLLGDGCLKNKNSVTIINPETFIFNKVSQRLGDQVAVRLRNSKSLRCPVFSITNKDGVKTHESNYVMNYLRQCGLTTKGSLEKFIPNIYLNGSTKQRLDLLNGLMDTDGTCGKQGTSSYSTSSKQLAIDITYLIRSLGGIARISKKHSFYTHKGVKKSGALSYQINIRYKKPSELFTLPKKKERTNDENQYAKTLKLRITAIEFDGQEECQCITIAHPEKLYITNDFVVTHNSSLLSQITPLPANHQDYLKDGYKIVEILHNNSHYELKSNFASTGNTYQFFKDGVDLNDGLTVSTFRELVKQEFKMTQDIQDVLVGYTVFTGMSVAERRNWFTKISDADYTYAIKYFGKLKEQHRDMVGAIKLQQSRLVQESEKLLTTTQEEKYRFEINLFNDFLTYLLDQKIPVKVSKDRLLSDIRDIEKNLLEFTEQFKESYRVFNNQEGLLSPEDIDVKIIDLKGQTLSLDSQIETLCKIIEEQDQILQSLKDSNLTSISDIDLAIDEQMASIAEYKKQNRLGLKFEDAQTAYNSLLSVSDNLSFISTELIENKDRSFNRVSFNQALERHKELTNTLADITGRLTLLEAKRKELEHFKEHNEIQCPKCRHTWHKGFEEFQYKLTLDNIGSTIKEHDQFVEVIQTQTTLIDNMRAYLEVYRTFVNVSKAWPQLDPLWFFINESNILFEDPRRLTQIVETLRGDLQVFIKLEVLNKQLNDSLTIKQKLYNSQESSVASFITHSEELHENLYNLNTKLQATKQLIIKLTNYKEALKRMEVISISLKMSLGTRESKTEELVNALKMQALNDAIELVRLELFNREQMISKIDIQHAVIMDIQLQISDLTERASLLKIALNELSPSQGLIAKGLTGFINHFVAQVNTFIKNVWLYPMELIAIIPDADDGVDLDYKFSVMVNDEASNIVPDIAKGSAGMREIINLAFKVVSMMYLGLEKAPLTLDEFGASLDVAHRHSAQYAITNLINASDFSQIFMVSHYESAYGSLKNSDICVLHDANIQMPSDMVYNHHVKIK